MIREDELPRQEYNIHNTFMSVYQYLLQHPALLNEEGVFRVPGLGIEVQKMHQATEVSPTQIQQASVHTLLSFLKDCLKHPPQFNHTELALALSQVKEVVYAAQSNLQSIFDHVLKVLIHEGQKDAEYVMYAEKLYSYLHLLQLSLQFQTKTKMGSNNLALMLDPYFARLFDEDMMNLPVELSRLSQGLIDQYPFQGDFHQQFGVLVEHETHDKREKDVEEMHRAGAKLKLLRNEMTGLLWNAKLIEQQANGDKKLKKEIKQELLRRQQDMLLMHQTKEDAVKRLAAIQDCLHDETCYLESFKGQVALMGAVAPASASAILTPVICDENDDEDDNSMMSNFKKH